MKIVLVVLAISLIAAPAFAGTWDPAYTWSSDLYGGSEFLNNYTAFISDPVWGLGWEYSTSAGTTLADLQSMQYLEWITDRKGNSGKAQHDVMLNSAKSKWRTDSGIPSGGPGLDYSQSLGLALGLQIGGSGSGYPAAYVRNSTGGAEISYTAAPTNYLGVDTNFKPGRSATVVDGITGNWLCNQGDWVTLKLVMNADAGKTWEAWLVHGTDDASTAAYMWGHSTGDAGNYIQFGFLGTGSGWDIAYDYVAFGSGSENIGEIPTIAVPEPGSLLALGAGLLSLMGLVRKRR